MDQDKIALLTSRLIKNYQIETELDRRLKAYACTNNLELFVEEMWSIIEPGVTYCKGAHISTICKHLEAVAEFIILKLVINVPPRHMKSILCCVMFPAWVWLKYPSRKFLYASYAENLAVRDSVKTRNLIQSEKYQTLFQPEWALTDDQNQKQMFSNTAGGERHAMGVGSGVTGKGGDYLFIDDPINGIDAQSEVERKFVIDWHDSTFSSRYNDPKRHAKVIIMQRLHEADLTGHVIEENLGYQRLILPARFDPDSEIKSQTSLGYKDPRNKKGQVLWPERFDVVSLDDLQKTMDAKGEANSEAQLQQDPKPKQGGLFPREFWQRYTGAPGNAILETVMFIDAAQKPGLTNDYSVIATWAKTINGFHILDVWRDKVDMVQLEAIVISKSILIKPNAVVIEDKAGGSSLIQYLLRNTVLPVLPYDPGQKDKQVRATAATPMVKAKKVYLPNGAKWVDDFIKEHEKFPNAKNDDQVDTTSMAVDYFNAKSGVGEPRVRSI